jgi:hypothetical protein
MGSLESLADRLVPRHIYSKDMMDLIISSHFRNKKKMTCQCPQEVNKKP